MNIKRVIKEKGWTIERLASEMSNKNGGKGITQPSMSQLINGNPTLDKLIEISKIIGVSLSELVGEDNETTIRCPHCGEKIDLKISSL